jgi:hypothetical protein
VRGKSPAAPAPGSKVIKVRGESPAAPAPAPCAGGSVVSPSGSTALSPCSAVDAPQGERARTHRSPETPESSPCCLHLILSTDCNGDNLGLGGF